MYAGPQAVGAKVFHPQRGTGTITSHDGTHVTVSFDKGGIKSFEAKPGSGKGRLAPREPSAPAATERKAATPGYVKDFVHPGTAAEDAATRQAVRNEDYDAAMIHLNQMDKLEGKAGVAADSGLRPAIRKTAGQMKLLKQAKQADYRALPKVREKQAQEIERTASEVISGTGYGRAADVPERAGKVKASMAGAAAALRAGDADSAAKHLGEAKSAAEGDAGSRILTGGRDGRAASIRIGEQAARVQRLADESRALARYASAPKAARAA